jgi:hypothetical protein
MPTPFDSDEYKKRLEWKNKSKNRKLKAIDTLAVWIDICGFGSALDKCNWELDNLNKTGLMNLLSNVYETVIGNISAGAEPQPYETVLILNDGIAKTMDIDRENNMAFHYVLFFRNQFFLHYWLMSITQQYGYGIRTVLAGGERMEYTNPYLTGYSVLHYNENEVSSYGKSMLNTTYVFNPSKLQMNTAFAKAYTIESYGSKSGINVNGLYIERSFLKKYGNYKGIQIINNKDTVEVILNKNKVMSFDYNSFNLKIKNMEVEIMHIKKLNIYKELDGDDVEIDFEKPLPPPGSIIDGVTGKVIGEFKDWSKWV